MEPIKTQDVWIGSDIKTGDYLAYVDSRYNPILSMHLEKKSDMVVMTVEEFKKSAGDAFEKWYMNNALSYPPDLAFHKTEYINQLIK